MQAMQARAPHVRTANTAGMQVAGTSGKVHVDGDSDDEGASTEAHGAAITEALGWLRRNEARGHLLAVDGTWRRGCA